MAENGYAGLAPPFARRGVYEGLLHILRCVFEPWETNPAMLEAFDRARRGWAATAWRPKVPGP